MMNYRPMSSPERKQLRRLVDAAGVVNVLSSLAGVILHDHPDLEKGTKYNAQLLAVAKAITADKMNADEENETAEDEDEAEERQQCERARAFKKNLKRAVLNRLVEYMNEAEHQDGYGYWDKFPNEEEAMTDFLIYVSYDGTNNMPTDEAE